MKVNKRWVLAGEAVFTIQKPHYTYKVQRVEGSDRWPEAYFVKLLIGPDNTSDFAYMGKLNAFTGQVNTTTKSQKFDGSYPLRLLNRVLARVWCDDNAAFESHGYHVHHEGKCCRCGRRLTVPASVESGIGPECAKMMSIA